MLPVLLNTVLISDSYQRLLLNGSRAAGATREAITKEDLKRMTVPLPPLELQQEFADFVAQVDKSYDFHLAYMPLSSEYAAVFSDDPLFPPFARLGFSGVEFMNRLLLLNCEHWDVAISRGSGPLEHAVRD